MLTDTKRKIRWIECVQEFFLQNKPEQVSIRLYERFDIMKAKVKNILKSAKPKKTTGTSEATSELSLFLDNDSSFELIDLFNVLYAS